MDQITKSLRSRNTTVLGLVAIAMATLGALQLLADGNPATNPDWNAVVAAVSAGLGLLAAKDGDKKSEDVGL